MDRDQLLTAAKNTIKSREDSYGKPLDSFAMMANMISVYLKIPVSPHDVCMIEIIQKICRLKVANGLHVDSWIDIAGYAALGSEVAHEEDKIFEEIEEYICKEFREKDLQTANNEKQKGSEE